MTVYTVVIGESRLPVEWDKLPDVAKEKIIAYGVQRIFNDKVGSKPMFPTEKDKVEHAQAAIDRFYAGNIGRMRGPGVDEDTEIALMLARRQYKLRVSKELWKSFTDRTDAQQEEILLAIIEKNKEKFDEAVKEEKEERARAAARKAKLSAKIDF